MTPSEILEAFALRLIQSGACYKYQGRDVCTGIDCWAIPILGYAMFGITLPDFVKELQTEHRKRDVHTEVLKAYSIMCRELEHNERWMPGDVVKFHDVQSQMIHGALVINEHEAIHAIECENNQKAPCVVRVYLRRLKRLPEVKVMRYVGPGYEVFGHDAKPKTKLGISEKLELM